jgi:hypothetical protein
VVSVVDIRTIGAATSPALIDYRTGAAVDVRRTVPPVAAVKGTRLPFGGGVVLAETGAVVLPWADQVQRAMTARVRTGNDQGIQPRRGPVRC